MAPPIPGPAGHPLFGHREAFRADPRGFLLRMQRRYGDVFVFRDGLQRHVVVSDPALIPALLNDAEAFADGTLPARWDQAYACSVSRLEGRAHLARRRLLQPAFSAARAGAVSWQDDLKTVAFDALVALLLGPHAVVHAAELQRSCALVEAWLGGAAVAEAEVVAARARFEAIVLSLAALRRAQGPPGADLLGVLAAHLDDAALVDEVAMMLVTHVPLAQALRSLARELDAAPALASAPPEHLCRETLRLHPPVWTLARRARHDVPLGPYTVPAGTELLISPYVLHRSPQHWAAPDRFAPERFDPASPLYRPLPRGVWLPFGAGRRKCIGERLALGLMQAALASRLQRAPAAGAQA